MPLPNFTSNKLLTVPFPLKTPLGLICISLIESYKFVGIFPVSSTITKLPLVF